MTTTRQDGVGVKADRYNWAAAIPTVVVEKNEREIYSGYCYATVKTQQLSARQERSSGGTPPCSTLASASFRRDELDLLLQIGNELNCF